LSAELVNEGVYSAPAAGLKIFAVFDPNARSDPSTAPYFRQVDGTIFDLYDYASSTHPMNRQNLIQLSTAAADAIWGGSDYSGHAKAWDDANSEPPK
jgi:hypothetical protein